MNNIRISKNFKLREFQSPNGEVKIHSELLDKLQKLRDHFGRPVIITSGYRTPEHNRAVGGAPDSQHLYGRAADIVVRGVPHDEVYRQAIRLGFRGVGRYNTHTHVDVRERTKSGKAYDSWDYRK